MVWRWHVPLSARIGIAIAAIFAIALALLLAVRFSYRVTEPIAARDALAPERVASRPSRNTAAQARITVRHGDAGVSPTKEVRHANEQRRPNASESSQPPEPLPSFFEAQRRADELTGLQGKELEEFHDALMRGLREFEPLRPGDMDRRDVANELRARFALVAEDLLGPETAQAYIDALFEGADERSRRYLELRRAGMDPEEAALTAGIIVPEPAVSDAQANSQDASMAPPTQQ